MRVLRDRLPALVPAAAVAVTLGVLAAVETGARVVTSRTERERRLQEQ